MGKRKLYQFRQDQNTWSFLADDGSGFRQAGISANIDGQDLDCLQDAAAIADPISPDYPAATGQIHQLSSLLQDGRITCRTTFQIDREAGVVLIHLSLSNRDNIAHTLGKCRFLGAAGAPAHSAGPLAAVKLLLPSGWADWSHVLALDPDGGTGLGKTVSLLYNRTSHAAINCSFLTFDRANTEIAFNWDNQELTVDPVCDFDGYALAPGEQMVSETFYLALSDDPLASLERWADQVQALYRPDFRTSPSIGWVAGWTWRDFMAQEITETIVLDNLDAIAGKLAGFAIEHIWISIGNLQDMLPSNWLLENKEQFPGGWQLTIREITRRGMKPGFWIAPFWIADKRSPASEQHRDDLLMSAGKPVINKVGWRFGPSFELPEAERPDFYCLDGTHPKTRQFLQAVFAAYYRLGIRYYMIDFLYAGSGSTPGANLYDGYYDQTKIKGPEVFREALKTIRGTAGSDTYILASTGPTFQCIGTVDAVRGGPDLGEGRPPQKGFHEYPGTYRISNLGMLKHAVTNFAATYFTNRKLYYNDSFNVLTVDKPVPLNEARIALSLLALSGAPVMLGDDMASISPDRLALIKKCLPPYPGTARPVDLFTSSGPVEQCTFSLAVETDWDSYRIIGILNLDDQTRSKGIDFAELGLPEDDDCLVYDFWNERYLGRHRGSFLAEIPAMDLRLLRIAKARSHPWLLSTDMHVTQGGVEIASLTWDPDRLCLAGVCSRPENESGSLVIHLPAGWRPIDYRGLHVAKIDGQQACILTQSIRFDQPSVAFALAFAWEDPER